MARLRRRVREDGVEPETAARELGVDPIIAQLWLRLPDDLWPGARPGSPQPPEDAASPPTSPLPAPSVPLGGLRRVLTCRVPAPAFDRLRAAGGTVVEAAAQALEAGLAQALPPVAPGGWRFPRRPLAVPIPAQTYRAVLELAEQSFRGDPRDAAGWLIARGAGLALPLPTTEELVAAPRTLGLPPTERATPSPVRFLVPPRRRPETRAPLPADDSAPSGEELRHRREAAGLSQRDLAAASGLSRGLVAEIERGRRRHVLTRLKLADTLAAVERAKAAEAQAT
jgi:DNA-binding XRE family transcriptional regulator